MTRTPSRLRTFQLALVASAAISLGACSRNGADVTPPVVATNLPTQGAVAPVPSPAPAPVVATPEPTRVAVAQNDRSYDAGRRDQARHDQQREDARRAARELPPRADRDSGIDRHDQHVAAATCRECGVVESVNSVKVQGETNGVGAVAGGVGGALVGNRVAGGKNRTLGGVVGALGGGLLGNAIEKHERTSVVYDVNVRMEDGSLRTVRESSSPAVGERVRVEADGLHQRG
jgi:outer membrane lipoprotein SlyB